MELMRLYSELAPWFHLVTHPSDYEEEAAFISRVVDAAIEGKARTLLELGSGGGNNASHLKARFACTLTDVSPEMLELSRTLNPECEHIQGDMRTLRLGSTFDVVLAHDAVAYMTTEDDLRAVLETVSAHLRPGGVGILVPDTTRELFAAQTRHGGHDGDDGRRLRYLEWDHDPDPGDTSYDVEFVVVLIEDGKEVRVEYDHQTCGVFSEAAWRQLITQAGLAVVDVETIADPHAAEHAVFVARKPA